MYCGRIYSCVGVGYCMWLLVLWCVLIGIEVLFGWCYFGWVWLFWCGFCWVMNLVWLVLVCIRCCGCSVNCLLMMVVM